MRIAFNPPPGLVSDNTSFASPGVWADGSNVRFRLGKPETIGGWSVALNGSKLTGVCRNILTQSHGDGPTRILFGTHAKLQVWDNSALSDITPAGLIAGSADSTGEAAGWGSGFYGDGSYGDPASVYYARTWALSTYGDWVIANPRGGTIYKWEGASGTPAGAVANAPSIVTFALTTPQRQILAFGCNEALSDEFNPLCIRGCDIEDIEEWTPTPSNNAFEHILEGGGRIVAARLIGPYVGIWTDNAVHLGQFVGNPEQTYRFDLVANHCGLIGPNAVVVVDQTAIWIGSDRQFRVWHLGGVPRIPPCPIHRDFHENLDNDQRAKIAASTISKFGEVWFHYPDSRDGSENSRYVAYSLIESGELPVWFRGQLERSAAADAGATPLPVMAAPTGEVYFHEDPAGTEPDWHIKSSDQYLDEGGQCVMLSAIEPDFEAHAADIALTLQVRHYPQSAPIVKGPYALVDATTKKNLRASGYLFSAQFSGSGAMRYGKPVFHGVATARR